VARTRWPSDLGNPGLLHRTGRSDRHAGGCQKTWARPTDRFAGQPERRQPNRRSGRTQAPDPTPPPSRNRGSRAGSTIHTLPAEYERMSVTPSSLQLGCRTSYYAQLLRPPCARFGVLGSWRYGGLPVVIPWPDKVQAVEATHAQLSMIDQAQLAPKRCCRGRLPRRSIVPLPAAASRHPTAAACRVAAGEEDGAGQDWSEPMGSRDSRPISPERSARALCLGHFPIMVMHPLCSTVPSEPISRMERSKGTVGPSDGVISNAALPPGDVVSVATGPKKSGLQTPSAG
jgi:hypothetical protein